MCPVPHPCMRSTIIFLSTFCLLTRAMASMHIEQPANRSEAEESSWRWRGATRGVGKIGPDSSVDVVDVQRRACDRHFMFHATYTSVQKWSSMLRETLLLRAKTRIIDPNIDVFGSEPWALLKYSMKNKMLLNLTPRFITQLIIV